MNPIERTLRARRPLPATPWLARVSVRRGQEIRRRQGRQPHHLVGLERLFRPVSAAADPRDHARLPARPPPRPGATGAALHPGRVPDHRRPAPGQRALPARQRHRPGHRPGRVCVGRPRHHPGRPARHGRDLEHPRQATPQLCHQAAPRAPAVAGVRAWGGGHHRARLPAQLRRPHARCSGSPTWPPRRWSTPGCSWSPSASSPHGKSPPGSCGWARPWPGCCSRCCRRSAGTWSATTSSTPRRCTGSSPSCSG